MTHRDGFSELSARNPARSDAGHRKGRVTPSESPGKPPFRSLLGGVGGRQRTLPMLQHRLRLASYPTPPRSDPYGSIFPSFGINCTGTADLEFRPDLSAVLLWLAWLDALGLDAEAEPPDGELGEVIVAVGAGEGDAVVGRDSIRQATLRKEPQEAPPVPT